MTDATRRAMEVVGVTDESGREPEDDDPVLVPAKLLEVKIRACARYKIPARNYERLKGATAREVDADARDLAAALGYPPPLEDGDPLTLARASAAKLRR